MVEITDGQTSLISYLFIAEEKGHVRGSFYLVAIATGRRAAMLKSFLTHTVNGLMLST